MGANGYRLPLAVGVAIAAAGAATVAVRPPTGPMEPPPVDAEGYFSREEIDRARRYQRPRRALGFAGLALEGGALGLVAAHPPEALRNAGERPLAGAAAAGIETARAGAGSAGAMLVIRRFPDNRWAPVSAGAVALSALLVALQPVL